MAQFIQHVEVEMIGVDALRPDPKIPASIVKKQIEQDSREHPAVGCFHGNCFVDEENCTAAGHPNDHRGLPPQPSLPAATSNPRHITTVASNARIAAVKSSSRKFASSARCASHIDQG